VIVSTIENLLRFAGSDSKSFRFDVDAIGDTILYSSFARKSLTTLFIDVQDYDHTFLEAYMT
jgi:hypothetical protein